MSKETKIAIAVGGVILGLGAFVLYRKNKINKSVKRLEGEGFTFEGCQNGVMKGTKVESGVTKAIDVSCKIFSFK
tara:strand:- start:315 stop:539 length:225 start_codon:yes stop_codon:yes gene_type:complete